MSFQGWNRHELKLNDGLTVMAVSPVIMSASRSTDIPAFFSTWFKNRLQSGYLKRRNPFNAKQIECISFKETRVIIFWSKNPKPLFETLPVLDSKGIKYYFQFTLNDYEDEGFEPGVPPLSDRINTFKELSDRIGKKKVIWRFDPLILTATLTIDRLIEKIANISDQLNKYTEKLVISFADIDNYKSVKNNLIREKIQHQEFSKDRMIEFSERLQKMNRSFGLKIATCAEDINLKQFGVEQNRCIDDRLLINLFKNDAKLMNFLGYQPNLFNDNEIIIDYMKDKGQRKVCGCIVSKDIGMYNTCKHLCVYCYANSSNKSVVTNNLNHHQDSEFLIG